MKKLFSMCLDKNAEANIAEHDFLVKEYDDDTLLEGLENITKGHEEKLSKSKFASTLKFLALSVISMAATIVSFTMVTAAYGENETPTAMLLIPLAFALIGIVTLGVYRVKSVAFASSEEALSNSAEKATALKKLYASVGVPENADTVDVIDYIYTTDKDGNEKTGGYTTSITPMWIYEQDEKIYMSDNYALYAFPKSSFKELKCEKKDYSVLDTCWTKPSSPLSEEYSKHGVWASRGVISFSEHLSVIIETESDKYELRLPSYEAETLSRITGLTAKR